jgi:DnaJ-domain-containing protein 1
MALPEQGGLSELSLPRVLVELHRQRFEGCLELSRERTTKRFAMSAGGPLSITSNQPSDRLCARLAGSGQLDADQRKRAEELTEKTGGPEARALLQLGLLDTRQLFSALQEQVRLGLLDCFEWPDGRFALDCSESPPDDAAALRVDLLPVIHEGISSRWSLERVLQDLGPHMSRYPRSSEGLSRLVERLRPDAEVAALIQALDGRHTLWQALQEAPGPRAMATAWLLDALGVLRFGDAAEDAEVPAAEIELVVVGPQARTARTDRTRVGQAPTAAAVRAADGLRSEVEKTFAQLDELDYYQLLGIEPTADAAEVKRAYLRAAKSYHPDALARSGLEAEVRARANRVFASIGKAYATLSDPTSRRDYDRAQGSGESSLDAERLANAETLFRKGEVLLRLGNFAGALEFLAPAVELWPDEADYQSALGWALYKKRPPEPEQALVHLRRAAELAPQDDANGFRLGVVSRALGESDASLETGAGNGA